MLFSSFHPSYTTPYGLKETSLKIFKHYKLKPSFPIMIKDNKKKDMAGVGWGTTPHPQVLSDQLIQILSKN